MKTTRISILGDITGADLKRLGKTLRASGHRLSMDGEHLTIRGAGPSHDPMLLLSNSETGIALRSLLGRSKCAMTSETDPGNGQEIRGIFLCAGPAELEETMPFIQLIYGLSRHTGRYRSIGIEMAAQIEKLRDAPTLVDGMTVKEWGRRAIEAVTGGVAENARSTRPRYNHTPVAVPPTRPLVLGEELRVRDGEAEEAPALG